MGLMFSVTGFTEPAWIRANVMAPTRILLWEGQELRDGIANGNLLVTLRTKVRAAVEQGIAYWWSVPELGG